jgi:hypothetical protein
MTPAECKYEIYDKKLHAEDVLELELLVGVAEVGLELALHLDEPWSEGGLGVELRRIRGEAGA